MDSECYHVIVLLIQIPFTNAMLGLKCDLANKFTLHLAIFKQDRYKIHIVKLCIKIYLYTFSLNFQHWKLVSSYIWHFLRRTCYFFFLSATLLPDFLLNRIMTSLMLCLLFHMPSSSSKISVFVFNEDYRNHREKLCQKIFANNILAIAYNLDKKQQ